MTTIIHFVGVDVSKDLLHINQQTGIDQQQKPIDHYQMLDNQLEPIQAWAKTLPSHTQVIFEHTGTYSARLAWVLALEGINFTALMSAQSKAFAQTLKQISKSDRRDAVLLTRYGYLYRPEPTPLGEQTLHQLRQRQRHLHELRVQQQATANRLHALSYDPRLDKRVKTSLETIQHTLLAEIALFEHDQDLLSQVELDQIGQRMQRVVGIGPASAQALCVATNGLLGFESAGALVKYVGIAPQQAQSGRSVRKRGKLIGTSVGYVRGVLYMAARSARRHNLACKALYERLRGKGKCHRVALIAVINKLLHQVFVVVKRDLAFINGYGMANENLA